MRQRGVGGKCCSSPHARILDDALSDAAKARQKDISAKYATVIKAVRAANTNRLNGTHRPRHLLSGLLECGLCGGPYALRGQDRYGCSNHVMNGTCANGRGIRRIEIEKRVLTGLKERLMAPEAAAEAMRAWPDETNRLNRERRTSGESERKELARVEKKIAEIVTAIEDGAYSRALGERLQKLEARQDELTECQSTVPADIPDVNPNIAVIYKRKVERLSEALRRPQERDEAAEAIRRTSGADRAHSRPCTGPYGRDASRRAGDDHCVDGERLHEERNRHSRIGNVGLGGCGGGI